VLALDAAQASLFFQASLTGAFRFDVHGPL
jgi:hypothetical protein